MGGTLPAGVEGGIGTTRCKGWPMSEYMVISPKNWDSFQHYKDRSPKWIKLHRSVLDDYDFHCLPVASKALAPLLWLLASEFDGGHIVCNWDKLAFRLRVTPDECRQSVKHLIDSGFFRLVQDASKPLAECKQDACLEKSREELELEREGEIDSASAQADKSANVTARSLIADYGIDKQVASDFMKVRKAKKQPVTATAWDRLINEFQKAGLSIPDGVRVCAENGWGGFKASWLDGKPVTDKQSSHTGFAKREYTSHIPDWAKDDDNG